MKINDLFRGLLLLVAGSVASVVSVVSAATVEVDGIYYEYYTNNTASVVSNSAGYSGDIVIPETIQVGGKTYTVTRISDRAFDGCSGLTSIELPESLASIGSSAFEDCSGLTSIE